MKTKITENDKRIDYFQKLEDQKVRGDDYEGTTNIKNYHGYDKIKLTLTIQETGKEIELNPKNFHLREFLAEIKGNLYSMYCIKSTDLIVDPRVKEFGTYFVIIKNVVKFLDLICEEIEKQNIVYYKNIVKYYEKKKINGEVIPFDKSTEYEYQKEYRIVLLTNEIKPILLKIGNISEFAELFEINAIDDMEIRLNESKMV